MATNHDCGPVHRQRFDDGLRVFDRDRARGHQGYAGPARAQLGQGGPLESQVGQRPAVGQVQITAQVYDQRASCRLTETERRQQRQHRINRRDPEDAKPTGRSPCPHHAAEGIYPSQALQGV